jgi:hypothetical protein
MRLCGSWYDGKLEIQKQKYSKRRPRKVIHNPASALYVRATNHGRERVVPMARLESSLRFRDQISNHRLDQLAQEKGDSVALDQSKSYACVQVGMGSVGCALRGCYTRAVCGCSSGRIAPYAPLGGCKIGRVWRVAQWHM